MYVREVCDNCSINWHFMNRMIGGSYTDISSLLFRSDGQGRGKRKASYRTKRVAKYSLDLIFLLLKSGVKLIVWKMYLRKIY